MNNNKVLFACSLVLIFFIISIFPSLIAPYDLTTLEKPYQPPCRVHILGTNDIGQDILSELIYGTRISVFIGLIAAILTTVFGSVIGIAAGYLRGIADNILMRITDMFLLIPGLPLVIILVAYLGPGIQNIIFCVAVLSWPGTARVVRSRVLQIREKDFVMSARSLGGGSCYIMFKHILPNTLEVILAKATLAVASAMLFEAGVSFLGLGDPVRKSWGTILHDVFSQGGLINGYYWWYLPPILCISIMVLGFTVAGHAFLDNNNSAGLLKTSTVKKMKDNCPESAVSTSSYSSKGDLLSFKGLGVRFQNSDGTILQAIDDFDLNIKEREKIALIGETGSGKSILLLTLLQLLPANALISGNVYFKGKNIFCFSDEEMRKVRGNEISYIPQGTGNALNPVIKIVSQVAEPLMVHRGFSKKDARRKAIALLDRMGIENAAKSALNYPHHYSGGMKERALVAMAIASEANILLADEPTKGLDWKKREDVLSLFLNLHSKTVLAVTHDLWFVERFAEKVAVMYASKLVEVAPCKSFFAKPLHPYSIAVLAALPSRGLQVLTGYAQIHNGHPGSGCSFRLRCNMAFDKCLSKPPFFEQNGHMVRCWRYAS